MNRIILIVLSLLLCCCHHKQHKPKEVKIPPTTQEIARDALGNRYDKIIRSAESLTSKDLSEKYKLWVGVTGSMPSENGPIIRLGFDIYRRLTVDEARQLIIYATENFLYNLSQYNNAMEDMWGYALDIKNLDVDIFYNSEFYEKFSLPNVTSVNAYLGKVNYHIRRHDGKCSDIVYSEPYEEAYKIVYGKDRKGNVPQKKQVIIEDTDPNIILEKKCNRLTYDVQRDVIKELKNRDKVWIQDIDADLNPQNKRFFWVFLRAKKEFNEEEGKKLFVDIVELCLDKFRQKDEAFKEIPFGYFGIKNMYIQINNKYIENYPPILGSVSIKDGIVKCVFHENGGPYNFKEQPYEEVYREVYGKERAQE